jgi:hypothetical protein
MALFIMKYENGMKICKISFPFSNIYNLNLENIEFVLLLEDGFTAPWDLSGHGPFYKQGYTQFLYLFDTAAKLQKLLLNSSTNLVFSI